MKRGDFLRGLWLTPAAVMARARERTVDDIEEINHITVVGDGVTISGVTINAKGAPTGIKVVSPQTITPDLPPGLDENDVPN